jgi:acetyltransferase-like isoleucine patch superfamily enzyme
MIKLQHRLVRKIIRIMRRFSVYRTKLKYRAIGQIKIASNSTIDPQAILDISPETNSKWLIEIGEKSHIKEFARLTSRGGFIRIGKRCSVNPFCIIYGYGGVTIGNDVRIAAHTSIIAFNHNYDGNDSPISEQGNSFKGVVIEDNVWIGAGVRILDGVTLGKRCVVGAGSVVTRSVDSDCVVAGNPARIIKRF